MPATVYYDNDADTRPARRARSPSSATARQGHAHALNLKDSGIDVVVGLREGSKSKAKAEAAGLRVLADGRRGARGRHRHGARSPTPSRRSVYEADVAPNLVRRRLARVRARLQHPLRADRAAGRRRRVDGRAEGARPPRAPHLRRGRRRAVPGRRAEGRDRQGASRLALAYAEGHRRHAAPACSTRPSQEETETDLFGEQVVLCGGLVELDPQDGYETLVEAGYQPEIAYFEALHEVKLIVDLIYEGGIAAHELLDLRHRRVRRDVARSARSSTTTTKAEMKKILGEIQSGEFAKEWIAENENGRPQLQQDARGRGGAPDREGRRRAARDDAVDRGGQAARAGHLGRIAPEVHTEALVFSAPDTCEIATYDLPEELGRGEVLLRNRLGLISPGTELAIFCRTHRGFDVEGHWARYPYYPGYCSVADVVAVGDRVTTVAAGATGSFTRATTRPTPANPRTPWWGSVPASPTSAAVFLKMLGIALDAAAPRAAALRRVGDRVRPGHGGQPRVAALPRSGWLPGDPGRSARGHGSRSRTCAASIACDDRAGRRDRRLCGRSGGPRGRVQRRGRGRGARRACDRAVEPASGSRSIPTSTSTTVACR